MIVSVCLLIAFMSWVNMCIFNRDICSTPWCSLFVLLTLMGNFIAEVITKIVNWPLSKFCSFLLEKLFWHSN